MTMTPPAFTSQPRRKLSISALFSLIFGILGCIPFLGGALALLLGIIGFVRTGGGVRSGRWMAVVGSVLGLVSVGAWVLFSGALFAMIAGVLGMTAPLRATGHDFLQDLSTNKIQEARDLSEGFSDEEFTRVVETVQSYGNFVDSTFLASELKNDDGQIEGMAQFTHGGTPDSYDVAIVMHKTDKWRVTGIHVTPLKK